MNNHGSCIWRVAGLNPTKKGQKRSGVFGHPVVWPGRELEMANLALLVGAALCETDRGVKINAGVFVLLCLLSKYVSLCLSVL